MYFENNNGVVWANFRDVNYSDQTNKNDKFIAFNEI